ncbi:hypothetical protein STEG23_028112, partial [Scotinomys teguina]
MASYVDNSFRQAVMKNPTERTPQWLFCSLTPNKFIRVHKQYIGGHTVTMVVSSEAGITGAPEITDTKNSFLHKDLEIVYSYLHGMEALSNLREHQLRLMCETVRYERHEANEVLYYPDDIGTCWYILLSGSVFIKESMFLPRS